jgi:hypothetical protein
MAPMPLERPGEAGRDRVVHTSATGRRRPSGAVSGSRPSPPFRLPCPIRLVSERWRGDQAQHGDKQQRIELAPHGITPPSPQGQDVRHAAGQYIPVLADTGRTPLPSYLSLVKVPIGVVAAVPVGRSVSGLRGHPATTVIRCRL